MRVVVASPEAFSGAEKVRKIFWFCLKSGFQTKPKNLSHFFCTAKRFGGCDHNPHQCKTGRTTVVGPENSFSSRSSSSRRTSLWQPGEDGQRRYVVFFRWRKRTDERSPGSPKSFGNGDPSPRKRKGSTRQSFFEQPKGKSRDLQLWAPEPSGNGSSPENRQDMGP